MNLPLSGGRGLAAIEIAEADLALPAHAAAVLSLLDQYALDPMGGGSGLSEFARANLIGELRRRQWLRTILAWATPQMQVPVQEPAPAAEPAGLAICIESFSTFACKPLLNIHDLVVAKEFRGRGIAKGILGKLETMAREMGCCKITLEVLEGNRAAQALYRQCGYAGYELDPAMGKAMFWQSLLGSQ